LRELPYLLKRLSSLEIDKFNFLMKEVFAKTKKGRNIMSFISNKAKDDMAYDKFIDKIEKRKKDKGVITDEYIHSDEL
jgi:adenylate kinase family enzyme